MSGGGSSKSVSRHEDISPGFWLSPHSRERLGEGWGACQWWWKGAKSRATLGSLLVAQFNQRGLRLNTSQRIPLVGSDDANEPTGRARDTDDEFMTAMPTSVVQCRDCYAVVCKRS